MTDNNDNKIQTEADVVRQALARGKRKRVRKLLASMHPAKIASFLEWLPPGDRLAVWEQVDQGVEEKVLGHLDEPFRRQLTQALDADASAEAESDAETQLSRVLDLMEQGKLKRVGRLFREFHPARIAGLLESLPQRERLAAWGVVEADQAGKVLRHLHDEVRRGLAIGMPMDDLVAAARGLEADDLVDLIQDLPSRTGKEILEALGQRERQQVESMLSFPEDSAGGLMNMDQISVRSNLKIETVLRYLRLLEDLPNNTDKLMVVDREQRYQGVLRLRRLLTVPVDTTVAAVMDTDFEPLLVDTPSHDVARRFEDQDLTSAPVVNETGRLLGRITIDDVVDVIREESERSLMGMAGLDEEVDMFAPVLASSKRRAVWLGINLLTAFLAAWVIGLFEGTLEKVVALAVLMPIVASMGGIAGSQTLTLVIRGLALGHLEQGNTRVLLFKEIGVALLNGILWALVVALLSVLWFGNWAIGGIIAVAILLNLLCASVAGVAIPLIMRRFGIDPALAGSVVLTTVTDVVGFFAFLGLATLLLI